MFLGLDPQTWLGLGVLGAGICTLGALFGVVLKDHLFTRSFEKWKQRQTLNRYFKGIGRSFLVFATRELASRTLEILEHYPPVYLREAVWASRPPKQIENTIEDTYFSDINS